MQWGEQEENELIKALGRRANRDTEIDALLFSWGDYCGSDAWYIWNNLGCHSIFGVIMGNSLQTAESVDTARANRLQEMYPESAYREIELLRRILPTSERMLLDKRYRQGWQDKWIRRKLHLTPMQYTRFLMDFRDKVEKTVDWSNILVV